VPSLPTCHIDHTTEVTPPPPPVPGAPSSELPPLPQQARDPASDTTYIVAQARLESLPGAVPKKKAGGKKKVDAAAAADGEAAPAGFEVLATFKGAQLVSMNAIRSARGVGSRAGRQGVNGLVQEGRSCGNGSSREGHMLLLEPV
jgi:hypothetical protein